MRALVISGGGSKGAFAGGIAEYLINHCEHQYGIFLGTSTGSLLIPLLSIGKIEKLKAIYTHVRQKDIFDVNPFIIKNVDGVQHISINHLGILWMFFKREKTFGKSEKLLKLIREIITEEDFRLIKEDPSHVVVTVSNLSLSQVEYKSSQDCNYKDFTEWVWGSANLVPFMSLLEKDGYEYADGGMGNMIPISEAIRRGATEVDVIVLKTEKNSIVKDPVENALELTTRVFDFMIDQIVTDDIIIGRLQGSNNEVKLNFYFPPEMLTKNSLIFHPNDMLEWWNRGYNYASEQSPKCRKISL